MSTKRKTDQLSGSHQLHYLNFFTSSAGIAPRTMEMHLRRGRALHGRAVWSGIGALLKSIVALPRRIVHSIQRAHQIWHTENVLRSLPPAVLRDIGIEGFQIPAIARQLPDAAGERTPTVAQSHTPTHELDRAA